MRLLKFILFCCLICCLLVGNVTVLCAQSEDRENEQDILAAKAYLARAKAYNFRFDSDSATYFYQAAAELYANAESWRKSIRAYNRMGWFLMKQAKFQASRSALEKALRLGKEHLAPVDSTFGTTFFNLGVLFLESGEIDSAKIVHQRSLEIRMENFGISHHKVASSYFEMGRVNYYLYKLDKALDFFQNCLDLQRKLELAPDVLANTYNAIASVSFLKGDYLGARNAFEESLDLSSQSNDPDQARFASVVLKNIGATYFMEAQYISAIDYYEQALAWELDNLKPDHIDVAVSYYNLGEAYEKVNDFPKSLEFFEKNLAIYKSGYGEGHYVLIEVLEKIGTTYMSWKNPDKALEFYQAALEIDQKAGKDYEGSATLYRQLGDVYLEKNNRGEAERFYKSSIELFIELYGTRNPKVSEGYLKLAAIHQQEQNWSEALVLCEKSMKAITNKTFTKGLPEMEDIFSPIQGIEVCVAYGEVLNGMYETSKELESLEKSLAYFQLAVDLINENRNSVSNQVEIHDLSERYKTVYSRAVDIAFELHRNTNDDSYLSNAFHFVESNKAFVLSRSIQEKQGLAHLDIPDSILDEERRLKVDIAFYSEDVLQRKASTNGYDTVIVKELEDHLFFLNRDMEAFKQKLSLQFPDYYDLKYSTATIDLSFLQQNLLPGELFIEYFWEGDRLITFVISSTAVEVSSQEIPKELKNQIDRYNFQFLEPEAEQNPEQFSNLAFMLYEHLLKDVLEQSNAIEKLTIVPDGKLGNMNFDLLTSQYDSEARDWKSLHYLIKDFSISTAYSATTLFRKSKKKEIPEKDLLAFSFGEDSDIKGQHVTMNVVRSSELADLPGSIKEVKSIAEQVDGDYYFGELASEKTFKEISSAYQILHLAVHGSVNEDNPDYSKLHFNSKDTAEDGRLHVFELYNMELNADLAVLSACNTGSGKYQTGEGIMSLGHAFSYAGVNSLLLTRWELSDDAAPEIMNIFYRELKKGRTKSEALRTAKLEYLEEASLFHANPFYWGSFFVLGDDSPVKLGSSNTMVLRIILGLVFLIVVGYSIRKKVYKSAR